MTTPDTRPITVKFTGMADQVPLQVSIDELHHLVAAGQVEVRALKIRPFVIEGLNAYYADTREGTRRAEEAETKP